MKRRYGYAIVVAGFVLMLSVMPGWGQVPVGNDTTDASSNTGGGTDVLRLDTTGRHNTAYGYSALRENTTGSLNTALGSAALLLNTTGSDNTAAGLHALFSNTTGVGNTAIGADALNSNTTGNGNIATGFHALFSNISGWRSVAIGEEALFSNTTADGNAAIGYKALFSNTDGFDNIAIGTRALESNITGDGNIATGVAALGRSTGSLNIALGHFSGDNLTDGNNNIYLGSEGPPAPGSESDTLRLGSTQTRAFITGVYGAIVGRAAAVRIDSNGQLVTKSSSARYKRDVETMGPSSQKLLQLRPVTFTYKEDPEKVRQYGLIAEQVAKVYPELVTHTATGKVEGVDYEALIPMLLNELQHQQQELAALKAHQTSLEAALVQMREQRAQSAAGATHTVALAER